MTIIEALRETGAFVTLQSTKSNRQLYFANDEYMVMEHMGFQHGVLYHGDSEADAVEALLKG